MKGSDGRADAASTINSWLDTPNPLLLPPSICSAAPLQAYGDRRLRGRPRRCRRRLQRPRHVLCHPLLHRRRQRRHPLRL
uniref:Uncharacterized protein n=1 Tax=Arundo donax TaxID=35708 RepID=A0A0A9G3W8_ARUDO